MRKSLPDNIEALRIGGDATMGTVGAFDIKLGGATMRVICGDDMGWDHVSVSFRNRCPTWSEMEFVRRTWFEDDEWVVQFSPPTSERINNHPYCLHMWRPQNETLPIPAPSMVGVRGLEPCR